MDGRYNTGDDATVNLKKAMRNSLPKNPRISDAEMKMKFKGQNR